MQSPFHVTSIEHLYVPVTMIGIGDYKYLYQWGGEREREKWRHIINKLHAHVSIEPGKSTFFQQIFRTPSM